MFLFNILSNELWIILREFEKLVKVILVMFFWCQEKVMEKYVKSFYLQQFALKRVDLSMRESFVVDPLNEVKVLKSLDH